MPASPEVQALIDAAAPYDRLGPTTHLEVQTFIIAYASGLGTNPNALANLARCENCLSQETLLEVKAYLLAVLAGLSTDTTALTQRAEPFQYIPDGYMMNVQTYLLTLDPSGPGITDPNALAQAANGFQRLSPETLLEIQVFLLANNAGVSTDPNVLAGLAKCFRCLPFPVLTSVITDTLNEVEHDGGVAGACVDVATDLIPVMTIHYVADTASTIDVLLPKVCCNPGSVVVYESDNADMSGATDVDIIPVTGLPGEENFQIVGIDVSAATKMYLAVKQHCLVGLVSDFSNIGLRFDGMSTASDWADRVEVNGGPRPTQATIDAAATFWASVVAAGISSKMIAVNMFAFDGSFVCARTPLIVGPGIDPWAGNIPDTVVYFSANGVKGSNVGVTYLSTGVIPTATPMGDYDAGLTAYVYDGSVEDTSEMGVIEDAPYQKAAYMQSSRASGGTNSFGDVGNNTALSEAIGAAWEGYISINRTAQTELKLYKANSVTPHYLAASNAAPTAAWEASMIWPIYTHAINIANLSVATSTNHRLSFAAIHLGLTQAQSLSLYNAVQALRTALGGGAR